MEKNKTINGGAGGSGNSSVSDVGRGGGGGRSSFRGGDGGGNQSGSIGNGRQYSSGGNSMAHSNGNQQNFRGPHQRRDRSPKQNAGVEYKKNVEKRWKPDARENLNQQRPKRKTGVCVNLNTTPSQGVIKQLQHSANENRVLEKPSLQHVIQKSLEFWDEFPSNTARLHVLQQKGVPDSKLETFIHSVYPIVHHACLNLMDDFLAFKRANGSKVERALYKNMGLLSFIDRLLKQRPLAFLGSNDRYLLPNLKKGSEGFEAIGTDREQPPLLLENYLSYDEMRISALVSLSSWSVFVNDGRRKNYGEADRQGSFQDEGVIVGQVGARLKREGVMDYLDCVVTRTENIADRGFGGNNKWHVNSVFDKLWGKNLPTFDEASRTFLAQRDGKPVPGDFEIIPIGRDLYFNVTVYKQRILIPAESLLCEANTRARDAGKKAYVHVVGLGLGVWRASNKQDELFVEAWGDALRNISNTEHIAHIDFSYIDSNEIHGIRDGEIFPNTNIKIHFSVRNLHDKVPEDCILVCSYAWDGNSLPGNEFWMGKMCSTGDSAAACSSCVAEIHNHLFNPLVSGDTLRVATADGYLLTWQSYLAQSTGTSEQLTATVAPKHPLVTAPSSGPTPATSRPPVQPDFFDHPDQPINSQSAPSHSPADHDSSPLASHLQTMETDPIQSNARSSENIMQKTSLPANVQSDAKKPHQSIEACAAVEVVDDKPVKVEPAEIPHPTVVGLMVPNPAYIKPKKGSKSKGPRAKETSQNTDDRNQSQSTQKNEGAKKSKGNSNLSKGGGGGTDTSKKGKGGGGAKDGKSPKSNKSGGEWQKSGGGSKKTGKK